MTMPAKNIYGNYPIVMVDTLTGFERMYINIIPLFGTPHDLNTACWCEPDVEVDDAIIIHHQDH